MDSVIELGGERKAIRLNATLLKNNKKEPVGGVISFREKEPLVNIEKHLKKNTQFYGIVGFCKAMTDIFNLIIEIADCDASVLITGETGTGKELIADAIQATSRRKDKPFVKVNCAVLPPTLLASELFGHVKGAFTDAVQERTGRFELADNGTIFMDEIAEMPPQMQSQLLRVIQNGTFEKVGESVTRKVNVRVIAATNMNIEQAIKEGKFREDLYFRLNVIPIKVPPLRERREDIFFLAKYFLGKFNMLYNKEISEIDQEALDALMSFEWPGNIRELENAIEFAFIRTPDGSPLSLCKLPPALREAKDCSSVKSQTGIEAVKADELLKLLEKNKWNKSEVARKLGVNRSTIWRRLKNYGFE
jgi:transcriptional regulator with PAS, ATPase and Fis domain